MWHDNAGPPDGMQRYGVQRWHVQRWHVQRWHTEAHLQCSVDITGWCKHLAVGQVTGNLGLNHGSQTIPRPFSVAGAAKFNLNYLQELSLVNACGPVLKHLLGFEVGGIVRIFKPAKELFCI